MSIRAAVALTVDVILGSILVFLYVKHVHLTVRMRGGGVVVPSQWLYITLLLIIAVISAWWLFGRENG